MQYCTALLNMAALTVTALLVLCTVASGSLQDTPARRIATSSVENCALTFEVVYPEVEGEDPYPICSSRCPETEEVWFDGVAYKQICDLNSYNLMIEATFKSGELQGCKMVPLLTDVELTTRQEAVHEVLGGCLTTNSSDPAPAKLSGFTRVGNSNYLVSPLPLSWQDGAQFCRQFGSTLAIIGSHEEQTLLQGLLTDSVWIGMNDIGREGDFRWIDGTPLDYNHFATGQPDTDIPSENCVEMRKDYGYYWNDWYCHIKQQALCEWLPGAPPRYSCPAGSHMFQNSTCFYVSGAAATGGYNQAINYCASRGMTLASIHSQEEETFVEGLLTDSVWIGMNDRGNEGNFRWIDGTPIDYTHFAKGQPGNEQTEAMDEHCVEVRKEYGYAWNDWQCNIKLQYLCRSAVTVE